MIKKSQNNKNIIDTYLKNLKATSPMDFEEKIKAEIRSFKFLQTKPSQKSQADDSGIGI
jgi:hypothetical protein